VYTQVPPRGLGSGARNIQDSDAALFVSFSEPYQIMHMDYGSVPGMYLSVGAGGEREVGRWVMTPYFGSGLARYAQTEICIFLFHGIVIRTAPPIKWEVEGPFHLFSSSSMLPIQMCVSSIPLLRLAVLANGRCSSASFLQTHASSARLVQCLDLDLSVRNVRVGPQERDRFRMVFTAPRPLLSSCREAFGYIQPAQYPTSN
jgi:hypothetical protein